MEHVARLGENSGSLKEKDHVVDVGVDGGAVTKLILEKGYQGSVAGSLNSEYLKSVFQGRLLFHVVSPISLFLICYIGPISPIGLPSVTSTAARLQRFRPSHRLDNQWSLSEYTCMSSSSFRKPRFNFSLLIRMFSECIECINGTLFTFS
jgi:hypothetical protein